MELIIRDTAPAHFLVKIQSCSLLDKCGVDEFETKHFATGRYKWSLIIYPNGHGTEKPGEYVSVYLAIRNRYDELPHNWEVNAVFSFFILDQISGSYHHTIGITRRFFELKTEWGVPNFISKAELTSPSNGYLIDDTCLIGAEVFVNDSKIVTECLYLMDVEAPDYHTFKISDFSTLKDVWCSENFTSEGHKWKIKLYPNGTGAETGKSLSIYMVHVASKKRKAMLCDERLKACFTVRLKNQLASDDKIDLVESGSNWFDYSEEAWGFSDFVSLTELNDRDGGFIVEDTCVLEIKISVTAVAH